MIPHYRFRFRLWRRGLLKTFNKMHVKTNNKSNVVKNIDEEEADGNNTDSSSNNKKKEGIKRSRLEVQVVNH